MKLSSKQIESILALSTEERYKHSVKLIADREEVWGLYNDGWALAETDAGQTVFPLWPAKEYAAICAEKEWTAFKPESFSIADMLAELLPKLKYDQVFLGIFYTPTGKGIVLDVDQFSDDLAQELDKYR